MKYSQALTKFLNDIREEGDDQSLNPGLFKILSHFALSGNKYISPESSSAVELFSTYVDFLKDNESKILFDNEFEMVLSGAATIASNNLSVKIDLNHLVLSALRLGVKTNNIPQDMYDKGYSILNSRGTFGRQFKPGELKPPTHRPRRKKIDPFNFENDLLSKVFLNRDFVSDISDFLVLKYFSLDLKPYLPNGVFMFIGNKSTGKSELAYSIAEVVFESRESVAELDLSMLDEIEDIANENPPSEAEPRTDIQSFMFKEMVNTDRDKVFLIKHFEFISKKLFFLLTQIFSKGHIFIKGEKLSFENAVLIITLDKDIVKNLTKKIGFQNPTEEKTNEEIKTIIASEYGSEFVSLLDGVYIFNDISVEDYHEIFKRKIALVKTQIKEKGFEINCTKSVVSYLAQEYFKETKIVPNQISSFIERKLLIPLLKKIKDHPQKKSFKFNISKGTIVIT